MVSYSDIFLFISETNSRKDFLSRINCISKCVIVEFMERVKNDDLQFDYQIVKLVDEMIEETAPFVENVNSMQFIDNQPTLPIEFVLKVISAHNEDIERLYHYHHFAIKN